MQPGSEVYIRISLSPAAHGVARAIRSVYPHPVRSSHEFPAMGLSMIRSACFI